VKRPDNVVAAADPESARKWRRDNADMLAFPQIDVFYRCRMPRVPAFRKPRIHRGTHLRAEIKVLGFHAISQTRSEP
jgi:hypothetical protein